MNPGVVILLVETLVCCLVVPLGVAGLVWSRELRKDAERAARRERERREAALRAPPPARPEKYGDSRPVGAPALRRAALHRLANTRHVGSPLAV